MKYNPDDLLSAIDLLRNTLSKDDRIKALIAAEAVIDMYDSVHAEICGTPIQIWIAHYEKLRNEKNYEESDKLRDWLRYEGLTLSVSLTGIDYDFTTRPIERAIDRIERKMESRK